MDLPTGEVALPGQDCSALACTPGTQCIRQDEGRWSRLSHDVYHDKFREHAYGDLAPERRVLLHRALALALEEEPEARTRHAESLLRHWSQVGDREKTRDCALDAAEGAVSTLAFRRAAELYRQHLALLGAEEVRQAPLLVAARWERLGDLLEIVGDQPGVAEAQRAACALLTTAASPAQTDPLGDPAPTRLRRRRVELPRCLTPMVVLAWRSGPGKVGRALPGAFTCVT